MKTFFALGLFMLWATVPVTASIIDVPATLPSIQAAIDSAASGDTVRVADGVYLENINFSEKSIVVCSWFPFDGDSLHIDSTIIDGSAAEEPVVLFNAVEDTTSVLDGFTIRGGSGLYSSYYAARVGGGILIFGGGARIRNNRIMDNAVNYTGTVAGGGIFADVGAYRSLIIENNRVEHNTVQGNVGYGGGIFILSDGPSFVTGNRIAYNHVAADLEAGGGGIGVQNWSIGSYSPLIAANSVMFNSALGNEMSLSGTGGGIMLAWTSPELRNNIVARNHAGAGGGISVFNYLDKNSKTGAPEIPVPAGILVARKAATDVTYFPKTVLINTVVADNRADGPGGGLLDVNLVSTLHNSIVWGNVAPIDSQINGSFAVGYSIVQGGWDGTGNSAVDPIFIDTLDYNLHPELSPAIDAGDPAEIYQDVENPGQPGVPLFPALGSLRNDMGAYGGDWNVRYTIPHGPQFAAFLERINSALYPQRQAIADSFVTANLPMPFVENGMAYFIYTGSASTVYWAGDANGWSGELTPMIRAGGVNFWYYPQLFEPDARIDYKFVLNGTTWILDPKNPNQVSGGYGPNSELAMPDYVQPWEIQPDASIPHGTLHTHNVYSAALNTTRTVKVYTPHMYEAAVNDSFPVMLFHDGLEYISLASAVNTLDNLIAAEQIRPIIAVFVPPGNRTEEYAGYLTDNFTQFIVYELMNVFINYRILSDPQYRGMTGPSYGGLITTEICYKHPEAFGLCAPYSPSYWAKDQEIYNLVTGGPKKDIKFYLDWGRYEPSIQMLALAMRDSLIADGYEIEWNEWPEGHSWGSWRAHLDNALTYFFPWDSVLNVPETETVPMQFELAQNYPNPFNPVTTIQFSIPTAGFVSLKVYNVLGQPVATLLAQELPAGQQEVIWDASGLASVVYYYQLKSGSLGTTRKMIVLK